MNNTEKHVIDQYGHKLRIRVCGIWVDQNEILLVHHKSLGHNNSLWAPPGGGMEFGENAKEALKREFHEETGTTIQVEDFLFVHEFLSTPLHSIELFFKVSGNRADLATGIDPEMDKQIITKAEFVNLDLLKKSKPKELHHILQHINAVDEIFKLKGYFKFE